MDFLKKVLKQKSQYHLLGDSEESYNQDNLLTEIENSNRWSIDYVRSLLKIPELTIQENKDRIDTVIQKLVFQYAKTFIDNLIIEKYHKVDYLLKEGTIFRATYNGNTMIEITPSESKYVMPIVNFALDKLCEKLEPDPSIVEFASKIKCKVVKYKTINSFEYFFTVIDENRYNVLYDYIKPFIQTWDFYHEKGNCDKFNFLFKHKINGINCDIVIHTKGKTTLNNGKILLDLLFVSSLGNEFKWYSFVYFRKSGSVKNVNYEAEYKPITFESKYYLCKIHPINLVQLI